MLFKFCCEKDCLWAIDFNFFILALESAPILSYSVASYKDKQQPSEINHQWLRLSDWTIVRTASEIITVNFPGMLLKVCVTVYQNEPQ